MTNGTTLTVHLPPDVQEQLGRLSERTKRTPSLLAAEAIAVYVARENTVIDAIRRGLDDMAAGRLVPHDEAMDELDAAIEQAARSRG